MIKKLPFLLLLLLAPLDAQDTAVPENGAENDAPGQVKFEDLPEEKRKEFTKHLLEAARLFQQERTLECLDALAEAEKVFPDHAELHKLRGSCYVQIRAFDKSIAALEEALRLSPDDISIRFNYAEMFFVTKQWKKAHDIFQDLLGDIPPGNMSFAPLVQFKIMLCKKKLGQDGEALALAGKYGDQDDSPYHYYAQAALAYDGKKTREAEEWIARANRIFIDPTIIAPWQDTLAEYGYFKPLPDKKEPAGN